MPVGSVSVVLAAEKADYEARIQVNESFTTMGSSQ